MDEETVKSMLRDFGLTEKEAEIYLFLAKFNASKGTDIAKQLKKDKGHTYQILRSLKTKGLVESTLEAPARFSPVPFESVIESTIRAKREETARIENAKKELLEYWEKIGRVKLELPSEKFIVIEGRRKAYSKIEQMVTETKASLSTITTVTNLLRGDQLGIFDHKPNRPNVEFRFLTELSPKDIYGMKMALESMAQRGFLFRARNPLFGQKLSPRMIIRDNDEALFFITAQATPFSTTEDDLCLWTNCKDLVQALSVVFEDFWSNSGDIQAKMQEIETGKQAPETKVIPDPKVAKKLYYELLENASDNIVFLTSTQGLVELSKNMQQFKKWSRTGLCVQVMAPIVKENIEAAKDLAENCLIRHTPANYLETTLIDGKHLFQTKSLPLSTGSPLEAFQNSMYTSDIDFVGKSQNMLQGIWANARELSEVSVVSLDEFLTAALGSQPETQNEYTEMLGWLGYPKRGIVTENEIINKIMTAKRVTASDPSKDIVRYYGSRAIGLLHLQNFALPEMIFMAFKWSEQSSFGEENRLVMYLKANTPKGRRFVPVAFVGDNAEAMEFVKGTQTGTPSAISQLVKKDELEVKVQGNSLFAGWTVPVPLHLENKILPPGCVIVEAYGEPKTSLRKSISPSGRMQISMSTVVEATLSFMHPLSKYSGPGTDAFFSKHVFSTTYPPMTKTQA